MISTTLQSRQRISFFCILPANGWRYPRVGGTGQRLFAGINFKPHKLPENAPTPSSRVHAVLASVNI